MASQSDEISDEENGNNSDIDPIEVAIDAGQPLVNLQALQFLENAKFTSTKANTNNENIDYNRVFIFVI